jgi:hypothetical protein
VGFGSTAMPPPWQLARRFFGQVRLALSLSLGIWGFRLLLGHGVVVSLRGSVWHDES